jgi:hypothetical protein
MVPEAEAVSPLTGRKTVKLLRCPRATVSVQSIHAQNDSINDVTSVKLLKNKTSGYNSMIMATHRKFCNSIEGYSTYWCWSRYPIKIKRKIQGTSEEKFVFESIPKNIFDYSLGGYYHRERWARTRRYHWAKQAATGKMQGIFFYTWIYTRNIFRL